jgi:molecular chaperone HscC
MPVIEAVVTVPAYFGERQRQATKDAATIAGLRVERIINEPTAAALAYGLHRLDTEQRVVVLDLGGGTFDVSVLEIIGGVVEIQGSAGDARLGGEDFTDALAALIGKKIDTELGTAWRKDLQTAARVRESAERAKRALGSEAATTVALPRVPTATGTSDFSMTLPTSVLETAFAGLVERMRAPIARALRDARALPMAIDEVLLVGGATRMACVAELASEIFGKVPRRDLPPDEAVAMGAAIQGALKHGDAAVGDLVVTDVAPFTLGISTGTKMGFHRIGGLFFPLIERGTVIPASRVERFSTIEPNQTVIDIRVFQGEHSLCRDNVELGVLRVTQLPSLPAGEVELDVRFTYDLNGLLEVEVTVVGTTKVQRLLIEQRPGQLTPEQVEIAREAMRHIKFHPRDSLPNRTALARADALFVELSGFDRRALGHAISSFRVALETQDRVRTDADREALIVLIQQLSSER